MPERNLLHFDVKGSSFLYFCCIIKIDNGRFLCSVKQMIYRFIGFVRANYNDLKNGICETMEFLELFLRNLLLNENHPLHNRTLHISGTFKEVKEPDIEKEKPDIGDVKADIEKMFQPKTAGHILKLWEVFFDRSIFGRSDVMEVIDIKPSRASELLKEMAGHGIIEPVSGHGKGKYRFREQGSS